MGEVFGWGCPGFAGQLLPESGFFPGLKAGASSGGAGEAGRVHLWTGVADVTEWRKSSYSGAGGTDNCVELAPLVDVFTWRKSSRSDETGGACVELAYMPEVIAVRDSKVPEVGDLSLGPSAFADLLAGVKRGELS